MNNYLAYILDLCFAMLFFLSFNNKIINIENFRYEISSYRILPSSMQYLASYMILALELSIFFLFVSGLLNFWREIICIGLLLFFSVLTWRKTRLTGMITCTCFGTVSFLNKFPIMRNLTLIGLLTIDLTINNREFEFYSFVNTFFIAITISFLIELVQMKLERRREEIQSHAWDHNSL